MATLATWRGERAIWNGYRHRTSFIDGTRLKVGYCLRWVREMFGVKAFYRYAYSNWGAMPAKYRHVTSNPPPRGSVAYYRSPNVSGLPGHIAIGLGGGLILTTDLPTAGKVGVVHYMDPVRRWGHSYVGYAWWVNQRSIWARAVSAAKVTARAIKGGWDRTNVRPVEAALYHLRYLALPYVNGFWAKKATGGAYKKFEHWLGIGEDGIPHLSDLRRLARRATYMFIVNK